MLHALAISFTFIALLISSDNCSAQHNLQKEISKSWLTANGYELKFEEDGNVIEHSNEIKNYWLSKDTVLLSHYIGGGVIGNSYIDENGSLITASFDTIPARTFFSLFKIEKLTEDSLILKALDSTAMSTTSSITQSNLYQLPLSQTLKLFSRDKAYKNYYYDSVILKLDVDGHFEKWDKVFTIYSNGKYKYKKTTVKYSEGKPIVTEYNGRMSTTEGIKFQELVNKSGIQFFQFRDKNRMLTHAINCDLKIFSPGRIYELEELRLYLPRTIENLVYSIYQLERE